MADTEVKTFPVVFSYTITKDIDALDNVGTVLLTPEEMTLRCEGRRRYRRGFQSGLAAGLFGLLGVLVVTLVLGLVRKVTQRFPRVDETNVRTVTFDRKETQVVFDKKLGRVTIRQADGEWMTMMLNPAKLPFVAFGALRKFSSELAKSFGERFEVK